MPLDPNNPATPVDESLANWRERTAKAEEDAAAAFKRIATAAETDTTASSGQPITEGGVFLTILCSVLKGRLAGSSADAQIWATDLTRDYLAKYNLNGTPK